jgi:malate/lactate dehydrogenase
VIGEHGDSEVLTWSLVTVGGMPLESFVKLRRIDLSERVRQQIDGEVRGAAYKIIRGKGATYYGIGSALARIVNVILHGERAVMTRLRAYTGVCWYLECDSIFAASRGRNGSASDFSVAAKHRRKRSPF